MSATDINEIFDKNAEKAGYGKKVLSAEEAMRVVRATIREYARKRNKKDK